MRRKIDVTSQRSARVAVSLPLLADENEKKEKCGLFRVWGVHNAASVCYQGIFAQQHRGQESAGIVSSGRSFVVLTRGSSSVGPARREVAVIGEYLRPFTGSRLCGNWFQFAVAR
jgi:hypothetical protein